MRISDWSSDVCSSDLLGFDAGRQPGNVFQVLAGVFDLLHATVQVAGQLPDLLHHLGGALLDVRHHYPNLAGCRGRTRGHPTDLLSHHRETTTMFTGRSEAHTSGLQSLMRTPYALSCFKKNTAILKSHVINTVNNKTI